MKPQTAKLLTSAALLVLTSCANNSSDPLEDYKGIKAGPTTNQKSVDQTVVRPDIFSIKLIGTSQLNSGNFVEGAPGEILLKVAVNSNKVASYTVDLIEFEVADRPTLVPSGEPHTFKLVWTAPAGIIQAGTWGRSLEGKVQITVTESNEKLLLGVSNVRDITLNVSRTNTQPKIADKTDLAAGVDENVDLPFFVDVEDPSSLTMPGLPTIQITPYIYSNTEAYRADGSRYVMVDDKKPNNPEKIGAGKWRFHYVLQVERLPLDRDRLGNEIPSAKSVDLCFQMRAISVNSTQSGTQQVCTKARYATQPPTFTMADPNQKDIPAGVETVISLKFSTEHALSVVSIKSPLTQIANLSGKKDIKCTMEFTDKQNSQVCLVTWTPACVKAVTPVTLKLKAESTLNGKTAKTGTLAQEFNVTPNPEACVAPVVAKGAK